MLQPTPIPPGMKVQVCGRLISEPNRPVGLVENSTLIYRGCSINYHLSIEGRSTRASALYSRDHTATVTAGWERDKKFSANGKGTDQ